MKGAGTTRQAARYWIAAIGIIVLAACRSGSAVNTNVPIVPAETPPTQSADSAPTELLQALRQMQLDKYIGIKPSRQEPIKQSNWTIYHYDPADCQCLLGDEYGVLARPGTESDKTVFWMDGGGACWPGQEECATSVVLSPGVVEYGLASLDPRNPLRDWNFVHVPYCDGSAHMGDNDADYDGDGQIDHHHWGLRTTSAAVTLMKDLFPQSKKILIAGCSAGGYGTLLTTPVVRLQFPEAQLYVVNQSGPGLYDPAKPETRQLILKTWNLEPFLPADCSECREQLIHLFPWLLARDPKLKIGMFSSYQDSVTSQDYLRMGPQAFQSLLMSTTDEIRAEFPDTFKRYFIKGNSHCVSNYYFGLSDISLSDWIEDLVTDSPDWQDVLE
jgi:hypothetical protein